MHVIEYSYVPRPPPAKATPISMKAPPTPSHVLSDHHHTQLFRLTIKASDRWKAIGRYLGFGDSELDTIVCEPGCHGDDDYYGALLKRWLDWAPPKHGYPTLDGLVTALRVAGKERLANDVEELFGMLTDLIVGSCDLMIGSWS